MDTTTMRCGVKFDPSGNFILDVPEELYKYLPIYNEVVARLIDRELYSINKYSSSDYSIYLDPDFIRRVDDELEEVTKFMVEEEIYPKDLLEPRESKKVETKIVFNRQRGTYYGHLQLPCTRCLILPSKQIILNALKRARISVWKLKENCPTDCYIFLLSAKKLKKKLSKKLIDDIFYRYTFKHLLLDFEESLIIYNDCGVDMSLEDTGFIEILDTSELNTHSALRYILETRC